MPVTRLCIDMILYIGDEVYRITGISNVGTVFLQSQKIGGDLLQLSYEDVFNGVIAGKIKARSPANTSKLASVNLDHINESLSRDIASLTEEERREFDRRWSYIQPVHGANILKLRPAIVRPIIESVARETADSKPPSFSTVRRWHRHFIAGDRDIRALFPSAGRRGWRTRRLPGEVISLARQALVNVYLQPERNSIRRTWERLIFDIDTANQAPNRKHQLPIPSIRWLYNELNRQFSRYDQILARKGKRAADHLLKTYGKAPDAIRPLERVEIDHTVLDIIVVDDKYGQPIARPIITAAIDVATRMIMGFHLTFRKPSGNSVIKCLRHAITPKKEFLAKYPDIRQSWPAYGVPETIVVDNGMEFHSRHVVDQVCRNLNINVHYHPMAEPHQKAKVERLFGIINDEFLSGLPGRTFSSVKEKGDYKPEKEAILSFSSLIEAFTLWVVDYYNQKPRPGTFQSPASAWAEKATIFPVLPCSSEELNIFLCHTVTRTIQTSGISVLGLKYQSGDLDALLQHGEKEVLVRVDTENLGSIIVVSRRESRSLTIPAVEQEYAAGLAVFQHKVIRKFLRKTNDERIQALRLAEVRRLIDHIVERDRNRFRLGWSKTTAQYAGLNSDAPGGYLDPERDAHLLKIAGSIAEERPPSPAQEERGTSIYEDVDDDIPEDDEEENDDV